MSWVAWWVRTRRVVVTWWVITRRVEWRGLCVRRMPKSCWQTARTNFLSAIIVFVLCITSQLLTHDSYALFFYCPPTCICPCDVLTSAQLTRAPRGADKCEKNTENCCFSCPLFFFTCFLLDLCLSFLCSVVIFHSSYLYAQKLWTTFVQEFHTFNSHTEWYLLSSTMTLKNSAWKVSAVEINFKQIIYFIDSLQQFVNVSFFLCLRIY